MISAILLAAGKSTRIGQANKLLLPFRGSTIVETVIGQLLKSMVDEVIVVANRENNLKDQLANTSNKLTVVVNREAEIGLTTSIQCGVKATNPKTKGLMICLGDMPLLTKEDYNILINNYLDVKNEVILVPKFNDRRGNPVIFSHHFMDQIMCQKSMDGCKPIIKSFPSYVVEVPVYNNHFTIDIDTIEDYQRIK